MTQMSTVLSILPQTKPVLLFPLLLPISLSLSLSLSLSHTHTKSGMEIAESDLKEELAVIGEDDEFYEEIDAPKFVDFTVPDRSRPDDRSWFCLRVGCDQQHEEVDPDALSRSFRLRVLAARSPNVRLHKALNRQPPRSIKNCPRSAPVKSAKDGISRFSTMTSISDKIAKASLKDHPISSLRSTPAKTKAKVQTLNDKKSLTTPRSKKGPSNHEPFRSVKYLKAPLAVSKNKIIAKKLFPITPTEDEKTSEVLHMKKLNISDSEKRSEGTLKSSEKKSECVSLQEEVGIEPQRAEISITSSDHNIEENLISSLNPVEKEPQQSTEADSTSSNVFGGGSEVLPDSRVVGSDTGTEDNVCSSDDNKENDHSIRDLNSNATNSEDGSLLMENSENIPQKEIICPTKTIHENGAQVGKFKRTTHPKPFRLRTDERGILKEANLEKKLKLEAQKEAEANVERRSKLGAQKETESICNHGDVKQQNRKAIYKKCNETNSNKEVAKAQPNRTKNPRVRYVESRYAKNIFKCNKSEKMETEGLQNQDVKMASSRQFPKSRSSTTERKVQVFQSRIATKPQVERTVQVSHFKEKGILSTKSQAEISTMATTKYLREKRASIVAKESNFHRFRAPTSYRRPETILT